MKVTISRYAQPHLARLALARLEAVGIAADLDNEETVNMDWLLAQAVGGIGLRVEAEDVERARQALDEDYSTIIDARDPEADQTSDQKLPGRPDARAAKAELVRQIMYHGVMEGIVRTLLFLVLAGVFFAVLQVAHWPGWMFWSLWTFLMAGALWLARPLRGGGMSS